MSNDESSQPYDDLPDELDPSFLPMTERPAEVGEADWVEQQRTIPEDPSDERM